MKAREIARFATNAYQRIELREHLGSVRKTAQIRNESGLEIVSNTDTVHFTRQQFAKALQREGGILPAIICVRNEEQDLPGTLLSIARTEALPVVVDNASNDRTAEIAQHMGAIVRSQPVGKKMAATQHGVAYVRQELGADKVLLTDGDTLVMPSWDRAMETYLDNADNEKGAAVYGNSLLLFGESRLADIVASSLNLMYGEMNELRKQLPITRGHNYGLNFDKQGVLEGVIDRMNPDLFIGRDPSEHEDYQLGLAFDAANVSVVSCLDPDAWVLTRHDRVNSVRDVLSAAMGRSSHVDQVLPSYMAEYGL